MLSLSDYLRLPPELFPPGISGQQPWSIVARLHSTIEGMVDAQPPPQFARHDGMLIHRTAVIEPGAVLKGPLRIGPGCFVAAGAYLRGGVFLADHVSVGPGVELKTTAVLAGTKIAHFNFVGDSLLGEDVNIEAGAILANHHNDRTDKEIVLWTPDGPLRTGVEKFGALVGDGSKIGANSVVSPGTLLPRGSVVPRLTLV